VDLSEKKLIRADEAQVLLLDRMLQEIRRVASDIKQQIPAGIVEPLAPVHVTTARGVIHPPFRKPWFSVSVVNDGPDPCFIVVNSELSTTSPYELFKDEVFEVDLGCPKIVDLVHWCETGSATLRVRGVR
jgi:hypothetical protein